MESPLAELVDVHKSFGQTRALDGASIKIAAGAVHAIVGENGAGKTTLMRILAGLVQADDGCVRVEGAAVTMKSRRDGVRLGIGFVQQHFGLIEEFTGAQNLLLGQPGGGSGLRVRRIESAMVELADSLDLHVDPTVAVRELSIGERQRLEILIAVMSDASVLILDEPTAALGPEDSDKLNKVIRQLIARGKAVVYISHKLPDVMEIASTITVMRKGRVVANYPSGAVSVDRIAEDMIGRIVIPEAVKPQRLGVPVLVLNDVSVERSARSRSIHGVNLEVAEREIVGIAGVVGSGQDALAELVAGLVSPASGHVTTSPDIVGYVPEDRAHKGLALDLSVSDNLIVHCHRRQSFSKGGRLNRSVIAKFVHDIITDAQVVISHVGAPVKGLSGGNQQKVVLARELERNPALIVAHNPYRGLDVGAILAVRHGLLQARDRGAGVLIISSDLDDLFDLADRIVVLYDGRVIGEVDPRRATVQEVGRLMAGAA